MPELRCTITASGRLVVPAFVSPHPHNGIATSAPARVRMMIDTGSNFSLLNEQILSDMGLVPRGDTTVTTALVTELRPVYMAVVGLDLIQDNGLVKRYDAPPKGVIAMPRRADYDGIIGLDVLSRFRLVYDGPTKWFALYREPSQA
jgi:hypothetical protein